MEYRTLGKTGLKVSEIGFGGEWLERHEENESVALVQYAHEKGINIIDCWMPDPKSRDIIGKAIAGCREEWIVQGHIGSTYQGGQYVNASTATAIEDIENSKSVNREYFDLQGRRIGTPQRGVHIVRMADGATRTVVSSDAQR